MNVFYGFSSIILINSYLNQAHGKTYTSKYSILRLYFRSSKKNYILDIPKMRN